MHPLRGSRLFADPPNRKFARSSSDLMTTQPCLHPRVQVIAHDDSGEFVECLDCKEILETGDLEELRPKPEAESTEDLSDA